MTREVIQISMDTGEAAFLPMSFFLHLAALAELGRMSELDLALSPVGPILGHFPELKDGRHVTWFRCFQAMLRGDVRDAEQLAQHPLRVGLSMEAEVNTQDRGGPSLADAPRQQPVAQTAVYASLDEGADADVARIIAANLGQH